MVQEEADSAKEEVDKVRQENGTVQVDKATKSNASIVVKSVTKKKSAERRSMNRLPQANNSPIMPPTPTMKTMAEGS